jgi:hypothetical protein
MLLSDRFATFQMNIVSWIFNGQAVHNKNYCHLISQALCSLRHQEPFTQQHIISQNTWIPQQRNCENLKYRNKNFTRVAFYCYYALWVSMLTHKPNCALLLHYTRRATLTLPTRDTCNSKVGVTHSAALQPHTLTCRLLTTVSHN